jgi:hypothetical protein
MLVVALLLCQEVVNCETASWLGFGRKLTTLIIKMVKSCGQIFGGGSLQFLFSLLLVFLFW